MSMLMQTLSASEAVNTAATPLVNQASGPLYRWPDFTTLDSLRNTAGELFHHASATELFGAATEQAQLPYVVATTPDPIATSGFGILVLVLLLLYITLVYRHTDDISQLIGRLTIDRTTDERLQNNSNSNYTRFLTYGSLLAYGLIGVSVVRLVSSWLPLSIIESSTEFSSLWWSLALIGTLILITLLRLTVMAGIGELTFSNELVGQLWLAKRSTLTLLVIGCTPPLALWLLMPQGKGSFWLWVIIIELIISLFLYLREILMLFLAKKVSILHCFLYLCAVEIFPLSLLGLLAVR